MTECRPQSLPYIEFLTKCHSIYPHIGLQQGNMYAHNGGQNRCEFVVYVFWNYYRVLQAHVTSEILKMVWSRDKGQKTSKANYGVLNSSINERNLLS